MRNHQPPGTARTIGDLARKVAVLEREKNPVAGGSTEWEDVGTGATAGGAAALPWAEAFEAGYGTSDFDVGRSPDPLNYSQGVTNDPTSFEFVVTNTPATGDGEMHILRSGLYRNRLIVSGSAMPYNVNPGYTWDIAVQARGQDAGGSYYFGPGLNPSSVYYSEGAYVIYWHGAPQTPAPNFSALTGNYAPNPAADVYLNLDDSLVTWPVNVYNRFTHGLNDADILRPGRYYLQLIRLGDSIAAGYTG